MYWRGGLERVIMNLRDEEGEIYYTQFITSLRTRIFASVNAFKS